MTGVILQGGTGFVNPSPGWSNGTEFTLPNFEFRGVSRFFVSYVVTSNDGVVTINILNPIFNNTSITSALGGRDWVVNEQYHFSVKVLDTNGNPVVGAIVSFTDLENTTSSETTDVNGEVVDKILNYKRYTGGTDQANTYHQWLMDDVTSLSPHTLTISKDGYQTYTSEITMDSKKELVITLQKSVDLIFPRSGGKFINLDSANPQNDVLWK